MATMTVTGPAVCKIHLRPPTPEVVFLAGYVFSLTAIAHLCMKAYGIPEETIYRVGPLQAANEYLKSYLDLDSPQFIPFDCDQCRNQCDPALKGRFILPCHLAFVDQGMKRPDIPLDADAKAYLDYWYPPSLRRLEHFSDVNFIVTRYPAHHGPRRMIHVKAGEYQLMHLSGQSDEVIVQSAVERLKEDEDHGYPASLLGPTLPAKYIFRTLTTSSKGLRSRKRSREPWSPYKRPESRRRS
ncbi:uncharacterized protein BXZ73DRAFT_103276 [Epithele typhae]|uniref:uncharacterized protein n=1 Tax=Epithele typhae TaxID=378194 RepID=UPI0020077F77|nr:uncharacterized protein BXZ73DRAFT_103276 [Epithele typhae]KAH9925394.1 hypothetical protein BXZ73DRAFT_103276 [Epithele typhae]